MIRRILITSTVLASFAVPAFAQNNTTIVREAVPSQSQPIVANSPQDLALQEEIHRIRAYNAQVNSQIGISDTYSSTAPVASTAPVISTTNVPVTNKYEGAKIEMFAPSSTTITYASTPVQQVPAAINSTRLTPTYTRIHRVVEGDTLYNLARRNCVSVVEIKNQNAMRDSNISIGQAITLPASQCGASTISAQSRSETGTTRQVLPIQTGIKVRSGNAYAVLPKDSLYSIGKRYCVKAEELAGFNGIDTATPIQPGQILRLPNTACK